MGDFATEIEELMKVPPQEGASSLTADLESMMAPKPQAAGPSGTARWGQNPIGWAAELGNWAMNNPGQAGEFGTQVGAAGLGAAIGAPAGPPGMALGAAVGNVLGRQGARVVRRMAGATPEEAPIGDPVEATVDFATGAAGQAVRPLARGLVGARLSKGALELPVGDPTRGLAGAIEDTAGMTAARAARTMRRVGEIGGIGSAIGGQPALGVALYLGSHALEPAHRQAAKALLSNQGFRNWIGEFPGQPLNWREAVTTLGAMSADAMARYGMGADVRDAVRSLEDTVIETALPPARAQSADPEAGRRRRNPFEIVLTPGGERGRDRVTGQFVSMTGQEE